MCCHIGRSPNDIENQGEVGVEEIVETQRVTTSQNISVSTVKK